jgi:hypothetical protein
MPVNPQVQPPIRQVLAVRRGPTTYSYTQQGITTTQGYPFPRTSQQIAATVKTSIAPAKQIKRAADFARQVQARFLTDMAQAMQLTQQGKRRAVQKKRIPDNLNNQIVRIYYLTQQQKRRQQQRTKRK